MFNEPINVKLSLKTNVLEDKDVGIIIIMAGDLPSKMHSTEISKQARPSVQIKIRMCVKAFDAYLCYTYIQDHCVFCLVAS